MYNNRMKNIELPENLFSNLGEIRSRQLAKKDVPTKYEQTSPMNNDYQFESEIKLTNFSNRKEYRDRIDKMYEDIKEIVPIDNEVDNVLYFNNYVEKGIVVKPKVSSLKQFWTEYRLINNEKTEKKYRHITPNLNNKKQEKSLENFDELFDALSQRVSEINKYIDELKEMRTNINMTSSKLAEDKEKLADERKKFQTYKKEEERKIKEDKENLKINFDRLQTIIDDLDKKLVSIDSKDK